MAENDEADAEAEELMNYAEAEEESAREMMGSFPAFSVAQKRVSGYFGERAIIIHNGNRLTEEQAGEIRASDAVETETEGLPTNVRGLIDYPLERPCVFTINVGEEPWSVWDKRRSVVDDGADFHGQPETTSPSASRSRGVSGS